MLDEEPEPSKGGDYPTGDLEREAAGLPPLLEDYRKPDPPQTVRLAFVALCVAAAAMIVGFVVMLSNGHAIAVQLMDAYERARQAGDPTTGRSGVSDQDVVAGIPGLLAVLMAGSVMIAVLTVLFGYKAREGVRSARTRAVAMVAIIAVFVVFMPSAFVNLVQIAAVVVGAVGLAMMYSPSVAGYFPRRPSNVRRWRG